MLIEQKIGGNMNRKVFAVVILAVAVVFAFSTLSFAADQKAPVSAAKKANPAPRAHSKPNLNMVSGTLVAIDNADPADVKLQIKNDADGSVRTVSVTPWTNITKVTDVSELKTGEQIRMMTRKVDDKDVALGIMFGKMKTIPPPPAKKTGK